MASKIEIEIMGDRKSQAAVTLMFAALCGKPRPPICKQCGGIIGEIGVLKGRCDCQDKNK